MRDRPKYWEIVCKKCMGGFRMSDEEVTRRLGDRSEKLWPEHCGEVMSLRHIVYEAPKEECSFMGCWTATNAVCNCSCRGRNHGVMNPNPSYTSIKIGNVPWYKKPIEKFLRNPNKL